MIELGPEEVFILTEMAREMGELGQEIISMIKDFYLVQREDTGCGFLSSVVAPEHVSREIVPSTRSKNYEYLNTGNLLSFDVSFLGGSRIDIEGVALFGDWPKPFRSSDLSED